MKKNTRKSFILLSVILSAIIWHVIRVEHARVFYYLPSVDLYAKVTCTKDGFWCVGMSKDRNVLMNYHRDCPDTIDHVYAPISEMTPCYRWYFRNGLTDTLYRDSSIYTGKKGHMYIKEIDFSDYSGYIALHLMYDGWQGWGKIHLCTSDSTEIELKRVFL